MSWVVTAVRVTLRSCCATQSVMAPLLVTSTVPTRLRISLVGSITRRAYSPNAAKGDDQAGLRLLDLVELGAVKRHCGY